jgi:MFS family permease
LGLLLGTGTFLLLSTAMGEAAVLSYGWRFAFLLSALLVIVGMVVRLKVVETPAFAAMRSRERAARAQRHAVPWVVVGNLALTGAVSTATTLAMRPADLAVPTGTPINDPAVPRT